jgi:hypothetical protein
MNMNHELRMPAVLIIVISILLAVTDVFAGEPMARRNQMHVTIRLGS